MKKLIILLIIVLVGIFSVNILSDTSKTQEATLASTILSINTKMASMTQDEINKLAERVTSEELKDAEILNRQWRALLTIAIEANKIILER